MFDTPLTPPTIDQATVDHYVARGSRLRSRAFLDLFRAIFRSPEATTPVSTKVKCA